jgi:hypothetical protein
VAAQGRRNKNVLDGEMMTRPKYPKPDGNNHIVVDALETLGPVEVDKSRLRYTLLLDDRVIVALKIADLAGQVDWMLLNSDGNYLALEVKMSGEENDLTDGERSWQDILGLKVVTTKEQVLELLR